MDGGSAVTEDMLGAALSIKQSGIVCSWPSAVELVVVTALCDLNK